MDTPKPHHREHTSIQEPIVEHEKDDDEIVSDIIKQAGQPEIKDYAKAKRITYKFEYGSKRLILVITIDKRQKFLSEAESAVNNKEGIIDNDKKKKETRLLHMAVKKLIEKHALEECRQIKYNFIPGIPIMHDWAEGPGTEVFNWDEGSGDNKGRGGRPLYTQTFMPPQHEIK